MRNKPRMSGAGLSWQLLLCQAREETGSDRQCRVIEIVTGAVERADRPGRASAEMQGGCVLISRLVEIGHWFRSQVSRMEEHMRLPHGPLSLWRRKFLPRQKAEKFIFGAF
jgi:hypothetical protein